MDKIIELLKIREDIKIELYKLIKKYKSKYHLDVREEMMQVYYEYMKVDNLLNEVIIQNGLSSKTKHFLNDTLSSIWI